MPILPTPAVSLLLAVFAVLLQPNLSLFTGLWKIVSSPCKSPTSYFAVGVLAATFLNMALVAAIVVAELRRDDPIYSNTGNDLPEVFVF